MNAAQQIRLKYAATINDEALSETTDPDYTFQYIDIGNVNSSGEITGTMEISFEESPSRARRLVKSGDVIVSTVRTYLQAIAPVVGSTEDLVVSTGFAVIRPAAAILDPNFAKYALRDTAFLAEVESRSVGVSYPAINSSELGDIRVKLLALPAQRIVAEFLDRETAAIDELISEKESMLGLLEEKRQALVSHAVTQGLNSKAKKMATSIGWLDRCPAHWETMQLKRVWASAEYGTSASIRDKGEIRVLRMSCITKSGTVDLNNAGQIEEIDESLFVKEGDILFNRTNSMDQIAKVGLVIENPEDPTAFASYLVRIRVNQRVDNRYLVQLLNSHDYIKFARANAIPAIGQANLSPTRYGDLHVPIPPRPEQLEIVKYIDDAVARSNRFECDLELSIKLLKERRSALITAAVTGHIPITEMTK